MHKDQILQLLARNDQAVMQAITFLQAQQTDEEQLCSNTIYRNNKGWNAYEAEFGASLAAQIQTGQGFSKRQMLAARQMTMRHAKQLSELGCFEASPSFARKEGETTNLLNLLGFRPMAYTKAHNPIEKHRSEFFGSHIVSAPVAMLCLVLRNDPFAEASVSPPCSSR